MLSRFSRVRLFVTLWTVDRQTPMSMGFSKKEYWSGLPCTINELSVNILHKSDFSVASNCVS